MEKAGSGHLRMLRLKEVIRRTGLSRSTIYEKSHPSAPNYDPSFPKKIRLGASAVAWVEEDIEQWLKAKCQESTRELS